MNRTSKYKLLYIIVLIGLGALAIWVTLESKKNLIVIFGIVIIFLIPGRICGVYWRDFFKGRNLMIHGRFLDAEPYFKTFLSKVRERPWLKNLIIISWGMYTRDIEVMTLNNLGTIYIEQGRFIKAKEYLNQAIAIDSEGPLPYFNLALIAAAENQNDLAIEFFRKSKEKGFTGSSFDQLIRQTGELLARIEGRINTEAGTGDDD